MASMTPQAREAFIHMVNSALEDWESKGLVEQVKSHLLGALERGNFNTERAQEMFCMAIEKSIWKKHGALGAETTRAIRGDGIIENIAKNYTDEFKSATGASDQRPARR